MSTYRGVGIQVRQTRAPRPLGVAILGAVGVVGSVLGLLVALLGLWSLMRVSVQPSREFGLFGLGAVLALLALRINWGFWERVKSSWLANLLLTFVGTGLSVLALRSVSTLAETLERMVPQAAGSSYTLAFAGALAMLVYHLIAIVYIFSIHATFGVGVKDERPLWQKVHRN